ncbi:hypothetical protein H8356DRAFT_1085130 [Neocallimastix lanati (nom. inval.)]|nr:hypothetical protein H8356DRAFT_1085130 [Neocallimastix sp. JGI-2020a]
MIKLSEKNIFKSTTLFATGPNHVNELMKSDFNTNIYKLFVIGDIGNTNICNLLLIKSLLLIKLKTLVFRSQLPISKETPYRSTLRDPRGKAEPTIDGVLAIPEELDTVNPLRQGLRNGILIVLEI